MTLKKEAQSMAIHAEFNSSELFEKITTALSDKGVAVVNNALPVGLLKNLAERARQLPLEQYQRAGVGRGEGEHQNRTIRRDEIHWIDGDGPVEQAWLDWMSRLQQHLNRRLYLGLFSFECHFAHYAAGDFYQKHRDAFRGKVNRVLSVVTYLNHDWQSEYGGELLVYGEVDKNEDDTIIQRVQPEAGTMVIFLSEQFPHEVLPAQRDRYSIAGWFRVNGSSKAHLDPPS